MDVVSFRTRAEMLSGPEVLTQKFLNSKDCDFMQAWMNKVKLLETAHAIEIIDPL